MKKIVVYILCIIPALIFANTNADTQLTQAQALFNKGKYQQAIDMYEDIKKANPDSALYWQAELEILKSSYYDWDLQTAVTIGTRIVTTDLKGIPELYAVTFYAYWWLTNVYTALKENNKSTAARQALVVFYEENRTHINDEDCEKIYMRILKLLEQ